MRISVFGLGYVGAVSAGCLARDGHDVVGVDIDPTKLDLIRGGRSPVIETGMPELIAGAVASGRLRVTDDVVDALLTSDVSLLCVGTPSDRAGAQDLSAVERLADQLGEALPRKPSAHGFVLRSTVAPGTTETLLIPTLARRSGRAPGVDFDVAFQPEFLREGASIRDYDNPPYTVVGTQHDRLARQLREVYGGLPAQFLVTEIRAAEMLKMVSNAFHALKITFANEVGRLGQALGVDAREVMSLVGQDKQLNISTAYLRPGFAFGGSCLPKDLRALEALSRERALSLPMMQGILPSNRLMIDHATELVLETGRRRVGLLGLSFKSGTDDLRESPLVTLAERFIGKGLELKVHDPEVDVARLIGANRRYIEGSIPHIAELMVSEPTDVVEHAEVLVVGLSDPEIVTAVHRGHRADQTILDLVDLPRADQLKATVQGICW